ncbi:MAG: GTP-binding protein, partial [Thermodesulfobacteriota bacterium]
MSDHLRNIALVGHGGAGKTSLAEIILYTSGAVSRLGRVEDGNTAMDFEPEEVKRRASISTSFHQYNWGKRTINLMDTPGDQNFFADTRSCIQATDSVIVVIDAVDGVKVQTEQAWDLARELSLPCTLFINKLDRERSDFKRTLQDILSSFDLKPIVLQLPIGAEAGFKGMVDLIRMKAFLYDADGKRNEIAVPADMLDQVKKERESMVENVAEADDALLERYLEGALPNDDEIREALKKGIRSRSFVPILVGSATRRIGIDLLMDFVSDCLPSPLERNPWKGIDPKTGQETDRLPDPKGPFSGFVFKTVADPYAGRLSIFRIISGSLGGDGNFYNINKESKERFTQLLRLAGKEQRPLTEAGPGSIVAVAKLKDTVTGDTLCDENAKIRYKTLEPPYSMVSFALKPKSQADEDKVL